MRRSCAAALSGRLVGLWAAVAVIAALVLPSAAWGANAWSGPTTIDNSNPPENVSCPSSTFCVAVGENGHAQTFNGSSWGTPQFVDPSPSGSPLTAISCPSTSFCAAFDLAGGEVQFNGSSWTSPSQIDNTGNGLNAVACSSASFCVAGDGAGNGFVYNGSSWSGPVAIDNTSNHEDIGGIACPSASFCVAVGQAGSVETSTDGGATWTNPPQIIGSNDLTSVSCPSTTFCVAVDTAGNAYTYDGSTWSTTPIDATNGQYGGGELHAVSCPSSSFCAAIDGFENVLMFNGSTWTAPQQLETGAVLHSDVSCVSSSFCVAVDGGGNAFTYGPLSSPPPPPPATLAPPVLGATVDASPVSGAVYVKAPAGKSLDTRGEVLADATAGPGPGFVRLTAATEIPIGSEVNALKGSIKLLTATGKKHGTQTGTFGGGIFKVTQATKGKSRGLVRLSLVEDAFKGAPSYSGCQTGRKAGDASTAARNSHVLQLLRASARGKFSTRGRYSAATVRGTIWTVADRCDGTLTHDVTDSVSVTDFVRHKTIILHAGQSYLAAAPVGAK
jgi:hypothetical protein